MKNSTVVERILFIGVLAAAVFSRASAQTSNVQQTFTTGAPPAEVRADHVLVRFTAPPTQEAIDRLNADFGARVVGNIAGIGVTHFQVTPERGFAFLIHLRGRPDVEFAEFDSTAHVLFVPNDPYYNTPYASSHYGSVTQWGPGAVSAPTAWDVTLGDPNIVLAVVDTGVDCSHPDLVTKCVGQQSYVGTVTDGFGHGTHVAGIAAAATNNGVGVAGICPSCSILSVKVLDDQGTGFISDVASGITYAADHGARVISMSLGGSGRTETLHIALQYAVAHNALPVCAMGNSGSGSNTPEPAYWYDCLSVIATDKNGARAGFSNYGIKADVAAPGVAYLSTMPTYACTLTTTYGYYTNYDALSGTSMATPVISGIAGLLLSRNPSLTPAEVKGLIMAGAGNGTAWSTDLAFGIANALTATSRAVHTDYVTPNPNLVLPAEGVTVSGLATVQAAPTDDSAVHHVDIVKGGTRFIQPLTGSSSQGGKKGSATAWTVAWPSTTLFNGAASVSAIAIDTFGNTSAGQDRSFSIANQLVSQSWTAHLCWPSSPSCSNITPWLPVTTGVATEAATHLQGTVTYTSQQFIRVSDFWVQVSSPNGAYYCGTDGTTVDCYPTVTLVPDTSKGGHPNYAGAQIDGIAQKTSAREEANVQWTLTYPQ
jgi:thermitase